MCDKYYDLPDTKSQRGAGFGYSSKLIKSDFEKMTENKQGVSIGESRQVVIFK